MTDNTFRWSALMLLGVVALSLYVLAGVTVVAASRRLRQFPDPEPEAT